MLNMMRLDWEQWQCQTVTCEMDTLFVKREADHNDLWLVALDPNSRPWTVAATAPLCPYCGHDLMPISTKEATPDYEADPAAWTVADFIRSLT
jgi:hypothetical protein